MSMVEYLDKQVQVVTKDTVLSGKLISDRG